MRKEQKISVIIPIYNVEKYLARCLESIINQTYKNLEIICLNDGSTDRSLKVLKEYAINDSRILVINKLNEGLSQTRNKGIEVATGEYITFVDSDDWLELDMIEQLFQVALQHKCDVTLCSYERNYDNKSIPKVLDYPEFIHFNEDDTKSKLLRRIVGPIGQELSKPEDLDSLVTAWIKLYKTELIKKNNVKFISTNEIGTEDLLFNVMVISQAKSSAIINKPLYHYWKGNITSLTSGYKKDLHIKWQLNYKYIGEQLASISDNAIFINALNNRICLSTLGLGLNELNCTSRNLYQKYLAYHSILNSIEFRESFNNFKLNNLRLHWKVFYFCNKHRLTFISIILLKLINLLRSKV